MKAKKYALGAALALVGLFAPRSAQADSIEYTINGTFGGGTTTLTGTLIIDSTTGQTISGTVTTTGAVPLGPLPLHISVQILPGDWNDKFNNNATLPSVDFSYNWPPSTLSSIPLISPILGVDAPGICGVDACGLFVPGSSQPLKIIVFDGGSLTEVVPEPSSLLLLGSGLLGLAGAMRRKWLT